MSNRLILVCGLPGSGKTTIGKIMATDLDALYIDKDTVSNSFTEAILGAIGCSKDDRESALYLSNVREHEYNTMMALAMENLEIGNSVICSAPFISELNSKEWLTQCLLKVEKLNAIVNVIWIHVDENTAYDRIVARNASRDKWKLENWDDYAKKTHHSPPPLNLEHNLIDNSLNPDMPMEERVSEIIKELKDTDPQALLL